MVPPDTRCVYPGCQVSRRPALDLCAKNHAGKWAPNRATKPPGDRWLIRNDGIVDWQAVEIVFNAERAVKLTWVERDIATMMLLGSGFSFYEAALRTGMPVAGQHDPRLRGARYRRLAALGRQHFGIHLIA